MDTLEYLKTNFNFMIGQLQVSYILGIKGNQVLFHTSVVVESKGYYGGRLRSMGLGNQGTRKFPLDLHSQKIMNS